MAEESRISFFGTVAQGEDEARRGLPKGGSPTSPGQASMKMEVDEHIGASPHERTAPSPRSPQRLPAAFLGHQGRARRSWRRPG